MPTKVKKTERKARRPKQPYILPELEPPSIPEIDEAANSYVEARDRRMSDLVQEITAHDALLTLMREKGQTVYEFDGFKVEITNTAKVKVKRAKEETNGEDVPQ